MSHRLLIVEDNPLNRELLCDWLDTEGFDVEAASSLREAFAVVEERPPQAVMLDVQLGAEDGLSLAAWIRNDPRFRSLPVIAVTAHAMLTDQHRVMQAGCNACVSKPIDFALLKNHLNAFLSAVP
jgi:two-component system sensor histidine kinase/response regulator